MAISTAAPVSTIAATLDADVFETKFGWFGLLGREGTLLRVSIGDATPNNALLHLANAENVAVSEMEVSDWYPVLREQLIAYAEGEPVEFCDVELSWPKPLTTFRRSVLSVTRRIRRGQTKTYAEIAAAAGSPGAARAVGTAMSSNRFPIVIPCHRVVGSGGGLGGFTSPQGTNLKQRMLNLEAGIDD